MNKALNSKDFTKDNLYPKFILMKNYLHISSNWYPLGYISCLVIYKRFIGIH